MQAKQYQTTKRRKFLLLRQRKRITPLLIRARQSKIPTKAILVMCLGCILFILTNRKRNFQKTSTFETGLNDCHSLIATCIKLCIPRLKPKKIVYRSYKNFSPENFLSDVRNANLKGISDDPNLAYEDLVCKFHRIVDKHAPLRTKTVRGNDAPFMNKTWRKEIYHRSHLQKKFKKNWTKENELNFKRQRNKCVALRKKAIRIISEARLQMG